MKGRVGILCLVLGVVLQGYAEAGWEQEAGQVLDTMATRYYKPVITIALGTFTYEYTGLGSAFSRYVEDGLIRCLATSTRIKLFARHAVENMDPEFREIYRDYFKTTEVDAILYGRFNRESDGSICLHLEMTSLTTGELIGSEDVRISFSEVPPRISLEPPSVEKAVGNKQELANLADSPERDLIVKVVTGRGAGAVYQNGEDLTVHVFVNRDAYVKVYHVDVNGKTQLIFPNQFYRKNRIQGGTVVTIPDQSYPFKFHLGPPYGTEYIKVVASEHQFADIEDSFIDLPGNPREVLSRGFVVQGPIIKGLSVVPDKKNIAEALVAYTIVEKF